MKTVPLNKVFVVGHGNKLDLNKMSQCGPSDAAIAFVGRSGERNGFVAFVERIDAVEPYASGLITVALGGSALSSFVQPRPFYTAQNIDVLTPRMAMSLDMKLYYCLCVEANRFRYSTFGREANRTLKTLAVPAPESVAPWIEGTAEEAVEGLRRKLHNLVAEAANSSAAVEVGAMPEKQKSTVIAQEKASPGPMPEVLKIDMNWEDAVKHSLQKKKPSEGWPK